MRKVYFVAFAAVAAMVVALPAWSLTVSVSSLSLGASNSADNDGGTSANTSAVQTLDGGGTVADAVNASENAEVRYSANSWADGPAGGGLTSDVTHSYDVTLTFTADAGTVYDVEIDTVFSGLVQIVDDYYWGQASAAAGAASVSMDQNGGGASTVGDLGTAGALVSLGYYDDTAEFDTSGTHVLTGLTGTNVLAFNIEFASQVNSDSDEAGILLGLDEAFGPTSFLTVSEYGAAGAAGRLMADDGHFLSVSATVTTVGPPIPEPATAPLLGLGLLFLGLHRKRA